MTGFSFDSAADRLRALATQGRAFCARHGLDWRHGAAAGGVLVVGLALAGAVRGDGSEAEQLDPDSMLKIEIVQPVEPVFTAGPVMEVGQLVDGFEYVPPEPAAPMDGDPYEAGVEGPELHGLPGVFRRFSRAVEEALPHTEKPPPPRIRREDRSYGFDEPRADYAAERQARREQRDRIEAERRERREMRQRMEEDERDARYERDLPPDEVDPG